MTDDSPDHASRTLWTIVIVVLALAVILGLFALRYLPVTRQPDIAEVPRAEPQPAEPVDSDAIGYVKIDPDQNAFELYREASANLISMSEAAKTQHTAEALEIGWAAIGDALRDWLEQNRESLSKFQEGSLRNDAVYVQPADQSLGTGVDVVRDLRRLARLSELEGLRFEAAGDYEGAWRQYRALLRASRHAGLRGAMLERLTGFAMHAMAMKCILRWAACADVDQKLLRTALNDARDFYVQTVPPSGPLSIEYLIWKKSLNDPATVKRMFEDISADKGDDEARSDRSGEPGVSMNVSRLVFANWLAQCDRPRNSRPLMTAGQVPLFQFNLPDGTATPGATPEEIERRLQHTVLARNMLPPAALFVESCDREVVKERLLEIGLQLQIRYRDKGEFPEKLESLVGEDLPAVPDDPFGHGAPLRYRRGSGSDDGATIWSLGPDGKDDDGRVDIASNEQHRGDILIHVKPPVRK